MYDMEQRMIHTNKKHLIWFLAIEIVVFLFCLHYARINPMIFQSRLSTGCFLALCLGLLILTGFAFMMIVIKKIPLHRVFLLIGFGFGVLSCLINTPGSIPDEPAHASNIYLWSNRLLGVREELVPSSNPVYIKINSLARRADVENASLYLNSETTINSYQQILHGTNWFYSNSDRQLVTELLQDHSVTPIMYLPAILGFTLARLLSLGYYPMLMLGRLLMLVFYVFAASWSIRKIPVGKMTLFVTALLPMSIHLAASLSYDAVILGLAMMTFAYIVYLAYGDIERIGAKEWLTMAALGALLAPCKVGVYLPILLLLFLIPTMKLGGRRKYVWFVASVMIAGVASCILMNLNALAVGVNKTPLQSNNGDAFYSVQWVLHHPMDTLWMMMNTVKRQLSTWIQSAAGVRLSWFSIKISQWVITGFECCLLLTTLKEYDRPPITPSLRQRLLLFLPIILCVFVFLFGMLLWWTPVGDTLIEGVQGRYFIPMIPLAMFAIPQSSITLHLKRGERRIPWKGFSSVLAMACVMLSCASFLNQVVVILGR